MRPHFFVLLFLIHVAVGQQDESPRITVKPPARSVVRRGEKVVLPCITSEPVEFCQWKLDVPAVESSGFVNSIPSVLREVSYQEPNKTSKADCTIIIDNITDKYNGKYTCSPFYKNVGQLTGATAAEIIVAKAPESVAFAGDQTDLRELMVTSDQPVTVVCEARNSRPAAEIEWFLDETRLQLGVVTDEVVAPEAQLVNAVSKLTHTFSRTDDGSQLRCEALHRGYEETDSLEVRRAVLDVLVQYAPFRPEGDSDGTLYGFTVGNEGQVNINFTANPRPTEMTWTLGNGAPLAVGDVSENGRLTADPLEELDLSQHRYSLALNIRPVVADDQDAPLWLRLRNDAGETEFEMRLATGTPPPPPPPAQEGNAAATPADDDRDNTDDEEAAGASMGGGAIAGIIIAVLLLLLIIALVAFARSRGKWCFAAAPSDSRAEASDTESAHDEKSDKPEKKSFKLSNLYSSLVPKKKEVDTEMGENKEETAGLTAPEGEQPPPAKKEGEVVYAELVLDKDGLKTEIRPSPDKTEYAVIVGTKKDEEGETKE